MLEMSRRDSKRLPSPGRGSEGVGPARQYHGPLGVHLSADLTGEVMSTLGDRPATKLTSILLALSLFQNNNDVVIPALNHDESDAVAQSLWHEACTPVGSLTNSPAGNEGVYVSCEK